MNKKVLILTVVVVVSVIISLHLISLAQLSEGNSLLLTAVAGLLFAIIVPLCCTAYDNPGQEDTRLQSVLKMLGLIALIILLLALPFIGFGILLWGDGNDSIELIGWLVVGAGGMLWSYIFGKR